MKEPKLSSGGLKGVKPQNHRSSFFKVERPRKKSFKSKVKISGNWVKSHNNCSLAQFVDYGQLIVERENIRQNVFPLLFYKGSYFVVSFYFPIKDQSIFLWGRIFF